MLVGSPLTTPCRPSSTAWILAGASPTRTSPCWRPGWRRWPAERPAAALRTTAPWPHDLCAASPARRPAFVDVTARDGFMVPPARRSSGRHRGRPAVASRAGRAPLDAAENAPSRAHGQPCAGTDPVDGGRPCGIGAVVDWMPVRRPDHVGRAPASLLGSRVVRALTGRTHIPGSRGWPQPDFRSRLDRTGAAQPSRYVIGARAGHWSDRPYAHPTGVADPVVPRQPTSGSSSIRLRARCATPAVLPRRQPPVLV